MFELEDLEYKGAPLPYRMLLRRIVYQKWYCKMVPSITGMIIIEIPWEGQASGIRTGRRINQKHADDAMNVKCMVSMTCSNAGVVTGVGPG